MKTGFDRYRDTSVDRSRTGQTDKRQFDRYRQNWKKKDRELNRHTAEFDILRNRTEQTHSGILTDTELVKERQTDRQRVKLLQT